MGFWSMIVQQTQNAFNDKAAQFMLVPLAGAVGASIGGLRIEDAAGLMIALPFVLFAPLAGWVSDRYSKRNVMLGAAIAQLIILIWIFAAVSWRNIPLALGGFFALATQSAFFGPAKIGITKELLGSRHLGFASGVQQMTTMLAILVGQIAMGFLFDRLYISGGGTEDAAWEAATAPLFWIMLAGIPAVILAIIVPRTPAHGTTPLKWKTTIEHFTHIRELWSDAPLRLASFGVAFFWGFAAFLNLWAIKVAAELTNSGQGFGTLQSWFMAAAGIGMAAGFGFASFLLRKRIELGWVPVAGVLMTLTSIALALIDPQGSLGLLDGGFTAASQSAFLWVMTALAFFAALFLAPLNAWMQDRYPAAKRGELQSAVNLQDCLAGIIAVAFIALGSKVIPGSTPMGSLQNLLLAGAGFCGLMTLAVIRLLPRDFVRVVGLTLVRTFYRIRSIDSHHVPAKGGVLLLPNHVTWADAFFITAASPRPVRFVMDASFMNHPAVGAFCRLFDTVPIALGKPREAIRAATDALAQGDVVCLFPEGQLTRTGTLQELQRGAELIARQAGVPVIPVWLDGAWGSIFSFERNRFFRKWPYRIPYGMGIAFGEPLDLTNLDGAMLRRCLLDAAVSAMHSRLDSWPRETEAQANGYQLGQINALPRRATWFSLAHDAEIASLPALDQFCRLFKARRESVSAFPAAASGRWVGGAVLRESFDQGAVGGSGVFFDFSPRALDPIESSTWVHCPCLAIDGVILAMSFPDPPCPTAGSRPQAGRMPGTWGQLLPGFAVSADGRTLSGPALKGGTLSLPDGIGVDDSGWVRRMP
jgi:acyl-[acyl-carrier-protein]-phospholipid O-acyltransferase/long-chain-fatty-acid--[acyl-carrier-protein] ligase